MSDIDLIPAGWQARTRLRRDLVRASVVLLVLVLCLGAVRVALWLRLGSLRQEVSQLRQAQARLGAEQIEIQQLVNRRGLLARRLKAMADLHVNGCSALVDVALQRALTDEVWLKSLDLTRDTGVQVDDDMAAAAVDALPAAASGGGTAGKLPPAKPRSAADGGWGEGPRLTIRGQSSSHSALADFVARLGRQAGVRDLKISDTRAAEVADKSVVEFELAVLLAPSAEAQR